MTKFKTQNEREVVLAFNLPAKARQAGHLDFNCHLDFDIWISVNGFWYLEFSQWDCLALL